MQYLWSSASGACKSDQAIYLRFAHNPVAKGMVLVTNGKKYVNMTDINFTKNPSEMDSSYPEPIPGSATTKPEGGSLRLIELMFFAYRDFVSDPDTILKNFDFGRAHHRVIHFVARNPGISVAELLDILQITKQSLARVLKQLVDTGYIEQRQGAQDRRQRLLYTTQKGADLFEQLRGPQSRRIDHALSQMSSEERKVAERFLFLMINEDERQMVERMNASIGKK